MRYRLVFIGVDQYSDPRIRDLSGAVNDARALWSLFTDTFPSADSHLFTDELATRDAVRRQVQDAMIGTDADDVAIVFFGGHGTRDHQLVLHDTVRSDLPSTTISMQEIADLFRRTTARAAILILDCCFSGGVTARVIEDSPLSRDLTVPLTDIAGNGRVIITASKFDEPAYELPGHDHGVLSKALVDVLLGGEHNSVMALMNDVMERVRAEALRMGVQQTPAFLGEIAGGITLPQLIKGAHYDNFFPRVRPIIASRIIQDLAAFGLPQAVLNEWESRFPGGLNDVQFQAVNDHGILTGKSLTLIAPTSAGKTFVGEMAAAKAIVEGRKAVFLLPYRALVNEKFDQFVKSYGQSLGLRGIRCTGDYTDQVERFTRGKYDLAILTYEMFLNLTLSLPGTLQQIGLVVVDEAQFITDPNRGIVVELLLTYLIAARERGVEPQVIALSAVIGDANRFHDWLGTSILRTDKRPVPLTEGVLDRVGIFRYVDDQGKIAQQQLINRFEIVQRREKPSAQDVLVPFIRYEIQHGRKVLVFRNIRGKTEGSAAYLSRDLDLGPVTAALRLLPRFDASSSSLALRNCLQGGTAFHNSNLTRDEREIVEREFRDPRSGLRVLVATTTVAAGINTPASTVVIAEQEFVGEDGRPFTVAEYKNMAGRAGRLGFNEQGTSVILAETPYEVQNLLQRYVLGTLESLHSSFENALFDTWILRLLATVPRVPRGEISKLLASTYSGYLSASRDPDWRSTVTTQIEELLRRMLSLGLAEDDAGLVYLTPLGRACGRSPLSFRSVLRLIEVLRNTDVQAVNAVALIALVQILEEADAGYTPMFKRGTRESEWQNGVARIYGGTVARHLQRFAPDQWIYWARCKRSLISNAWMSGEPIESIEQKFSVNPFQGKVGPGDIRGIADRTRWFLRSVHEIVALMFLDKAPGLSEIEGFARSLEVGIPREAIDLLGIEIPLQRGEYLALWQAGIRNRKLFESAERPQLAALLGAERMKQLRPEPAERREEIPASTT